MVDPSVIKCLRKCEDGRSASLFSSATSDRSYSGVEEIMELCEQLYKLLFNNSSTTSV